MKTRSGFTLVEILVTVGIIALICALVLLPNVLRSRLNANDSIAQANLKNISTALESYMIVNSQYPADTDLLLADAPPYLQTDFFDGQPHSGFNYVADTLTGYTYGISAAPISASHGTRSFTMSTGGVLNAN
jgi:prepilin-type N-terminal cleavage/methylation domain-containing protein